MVGFGHFLFPRSQKIINFQNRDLKWAQTGHIFEICSDWVWFLGLVLGLEPNNNLVGQEKPSCPGRMITTREQETIIMYTMCHVPTAHSVYSSVVVRVGGHGMVCVTHLPITPWHRPRGEAMPTPGRREGRKRMRPYAAEG